MIVTILSTALIIAAIALTAAYLWAFHAEPEREPSRWILVAWTVCLIGAFAVHAIAELCR